MFSISTILPLIPALPLAACLLTAALGPRVLREKSHLPALVALPLAWFLSVLLCVQVWNSAHTRQPDSGGPSGAAASTPSASTPSAMGFEQVVTLWTWADLPGAAPGVTVVAEPGALAVQQTSTTRPFRIDVVLRADALSAMMLAMVTFVASLVVWYASSYMHSDAGYWRFFTYVSLFVFSMCMLVTVSNFLLLYVFWEAVGVCSYLLIGFWYQKPEAAAAGKKAFLVNRIGDFGFALGIFLIWVTYQSLSFHDVTLADGSMLPGVLGQSRLAADEFTGGAVGLAIALCLMLGACGKSAQFPLHVWLPDAMEGPTPVSALIHAATMVTAGVYLTVRCAPLFLVGSLDLYGFDARHVVAGIGAFTALLAGAIALTQNDLKRVLAYSTVSQLGYMFLAVGTGSLAGIIAGMFHLFTHAFFKALLFLGAGSVMHAMGNVIDMRFFGGLRKIMPVTCMTMAVGCLALSGVFPFAGFWSKDSILGAVHDRAFHADAHAASHATGDSHGNAALAAATAPSAQGAAGDQPAASDAWFYRYLYIAGIVSAFFTAVYTFRAFFVTFYGEEKVPQEAGHHAHESPPAMTWPLVILAICATVVGFGQVAFTTFLELTPSLRTDTIVATGPAHAFHFEVAATSTLVALAGIGLAAYFYLGDRREATRIARLAEGLERISSGKAASTLGLGLAVKPLQWLHKLSLNKFYFDELYDLAIIGPLKKLASASFWVDRRLVDGLVDRIGGIPPLVGSSLRALQGGLLPYYALAMVLGMLVLVGTVVMWGVW